MRINFEDLFKEQLIYILLPVILLIVFIGGTIYTGSALIKNGADFKTKQDTYQELTEKKTNLEAQIEEQKHQEISKDVKKIFTLESANFGVDASFAPLFDNMIAIAKESGIRIRSVEYNFEPAEDPIFKAKLSGYNVCELSTTVVGHYTELQAFLKTLLAQDYLVNLANVEIISWKRDKSILIANLKLNFYTKTN